MTEVLAELSYDPQAGRGDPLRLQAVLKLDLYQIGEILNAPRDQDGKLIRAAQPAEVALTDEERFYRHWRLRRLPEWAIARKWQEEQAKGAEGGESTDGF